MKPSKAGRRETSMEPAAAAAERRLRAAREILRRHPDASFDNVWHTLTLLDLPPAGRLNLSLTRGRARRSPLPIV